MTQSNSPAAMRRALSDTPAKIKRQQRVCVRELTKLGKMHEEQSDDLVNLKAGEVCAIGTSSAMKVAPPLTVECLPDTIFAETGRWHCRRAR